MFGKNRRLKIAAFGALVALGFIAFQGVTSAHHPDISASAECISETTARITVDVVAWNDGNPSDDHRTNNHIVVTIGGQTFQGAFNKANDFEFTITLDVPADGKSYTAKAEANGPWGPNEDIIVPASYRKAWVTVPEGCPGEETTIPTTTVAPTTTLAPTTTVAPTSSTSSTTTTTTTTTTTIPVNVQGVVETAPSTTVVGVAVEGVVLARTGTNVMPFIIGGFVLVLLGTAVELTARRRRNA